MIVDASAIVAILMREPEADALLSRLEAAEDAATHPVALYEAASAVSRIKGEPLEAAALTVSAFLAEAEIEVVSLTSADAEGALGAATRFGRGRGRPARLNMGDCFSYACAKARGVPLLYKGDDFTRTDLA